ncbi:MAG: U4/U6.U5 snRNP associated protein [Alyxoria varia]|nr:MAG: U4/U6.U5 snRNP associated protein [Alyxoria varia]
MGDSGGGAYASKASDTSFRKTWDRDEFAKKAADRERKVKEEGKARHEAALEGKKYHRRASTPPDAKETESRRERLDVASQVGKQTLVPAATAVGKRGKGAGFYCDACDLTFKDNLQLVEHLNSRQHLVAIGQTGEVKRATLQAVKDRLAWLKRKKDEEKEADVVDLGKRLEVRAEQDAQEREEKRRKRNEKRRKTKDGVDNAKEKDLGDGVIC